MDSLSVAILTTSVGLLGIVVGSLLSKHNEHKQWLRNEKYKGYNEFLRRYKEAERSMVHLLRGYHDERETALKRVYELSRSQTFLLSSNSVFERQKELVSFVGDTVRGTDQDEPKVTKEEMDAKEQVDLKLSSALELAMRKDLRIRWSRFRYAKLPRRLRADNEGANVE